MIVTELYGGLGNQMFQYAIGRALASKHDATLKLDTSRFKDYPLRSYALGHLSIEADELTDNERSKLQVIQISTNWVARLAKRLFGRNGLYLVSERSFAFDPSVLSASAACYLRGYWQSPKYFAAIEPQIRREFTVRAPLEGRNLELSQEMAGSMSVSLHVRRGDYASNAHTNRFHGTCGPEYYVAAEAALIERLGAFRLFVFSDDPEWARANLRLESPVTFVHHNGPERDYEDLRLMSLCHHHIIANSTFSWWGGWLCANDAKLVVAPRAWFRGVNHDTSDLVPESWLQV